MGDRGRYLLTGGAGFIGSHLLDALLGRGAEVTVVDDFNDYYDPAIKRENLAAHRGEPRLRVLEADVRDPALWAGLPPEGWTAVLHIAARAGVRPSLAEPALYVSTNVGGTGRLLDWAVSGSRPVPVLFASSSSIYGDDTPAPFREDAVPAPVSPYAATKAAAEQLLSAWTRCHGLPTVALRFFTVYGPRQRPDLAIHKFARLIERGEAIPVFGDGSMARDYTHVADAVRGTLAALDGLVEGRLRHGVYNLGSDRAIRLDAMIEAVERAVGRTARVDRRPVPAGDVRRTWADLGRSEAELGYRPSLSFEEGLRDFVSWMRR